MTVNNSLAGWSHLQGIKPEHVREELHRIIGSKAINSDRHKKFLAYIVEQTLAGRGDHIKAYTIATEVFDRGEDFDSAADPIVRVEAGRLRRALEHYYLTSGVNDPLKIEIPKGGYLPDFHVKAGKALDHVDIHEKTAELKPGACLPTVVVMPFLYHGNDTSYEYFASGLCEEVIIALNRFSDLKVISGDLTIASDTESCDVLSQCKKLKARFALTGSVRVDKSMFRVGIQIHDAESGSQIMGRQYEYPNNTRNLFAVQDDITRQVVMNTADIYDGVIHKVMTGEQHGKDFDTTSYDAMLRLHYYNTAFSEESYFNARKAAEKAIKSDPENPRVWAAYSELSGDGYSHGFSQDDRETAYANALQASRTAISLDRTCDYAYWTLAVAAIQAREKETVINAANTLHKLQPPASTHALAGWSLTVAGQWERGLEILHRYMLELQVYPGWLHHAPFLDYYRQGRYEEALNETVKMNVPMLVWDPVERAAALGQLGRSDAADIAIKEILSVRPDFVDDPRRYLNCYIMQDELVDHVIEGLVMAGLPETTVTS